MSYAKPILKASVLALGLLLYACSLIEEDTSNCPEQIRVYFTYTPKAGNEGIDPSDVDRMHLYVFCHKGYFLGEYREEGIAFGPDYYMDCSDLLPGRYRLIAWGSKGEGCYRTTPTDFVKGETTFDEALLALAHTGNTVNYTPHPLFHGEIKAATVTTQKIQRFDVPLVQLSNTINIRTTGLPDDAHAYTFHIADDNCTYTFDRSFAADHLCHAIRYTAPCTKDAQGQLASSLGVLRLAAGRRHPQLQIRNETTGEPLYPAGTQSGDLIGLILSASPQNDFDQVHTYDIVLNFADGAAGLSVTITINGWVVRAQNGELLPE